MVVVVVVVVKEQQKQSGYDGIIHDIITIMSHTFSLVSLSSAVSI